jgi:hypothetical protein
MLLDTARWRWASLVPFPTSFANSPKRTCDRHVVPFIQRSRGILFQGTARLPDFIQERLGQAR